MKRWRTVWLVVVMTCSMPLGSCMVDGNNLVGEILYPVSPDASCQVQVSNPPTTAGEYDPGFYDQNYRQPSYHMWVILRNNMQKQADQVQSLGQTNIHPAANDLQVVGFEGCWFFDNPQNPNFGIGAFAKGQTVDCSTLPNQSGSLPTAQITADEGQGLGLYEIDVLPLNALQQIFGADFNPAAIPIIGPYAIPVGLVSEPNSAYRFSFLSSDPSDPNNRDANWGKVYPANREATVVVQLRAVMHDQTGGVLYSGWFSYPIRLCVGCFFARACDVDLQRSLCAGTFCPDGTPCLTATENATFACPNSTPPLAQGACPQVYEFIGTSAYPNYSAACHPAQASQSTGQALAQCQTVACD